MTNSSTLEIFKSLIAGQESIIKSQREIISDKQNTIGKIYDDIEASRHLIHASMETIEILNESVKAYTK